MTAAERTADIMARYGLSKSTAQRLNNHSDAYIRMYANKHHGAAVTAINALCTTKPRCTAKPCKFDNGD